MFVVSYAEREIHTPTVFAYIWMSWHTSSTNFTRQLGTHRCQLLRQLISHGIWHTQVPSHTPTQFAWYLAHKCEASIREQCSRIKIALQWRQSYANLIRLKNGTVVSGHFTPIAVGVKIWHPGLRRDTPTETSSWRTISAH